MVTTDDIRRVDKQLELQFSYDTRNSSFHYTLSFFKMFRIQENFSSLSFHSMG